MNFAFLNPTWLWLTLILVPCVLIALLFFRSMSPARRFSAILLRVGLIALLASMLAGISNIRTSNRAAVVAVIDVSGSVRAFATDPKPALDRVREYLRSAAGARSREDLLGIVVFDGTTTAIAAPQPGTGKPASSSTPSTQPLDQPTDLVDRTWETTPPNPEATDIAAAIRLAAAMIPPDASGRLLLFSDGNQTNADALAVARSVTGATTRPLPIDVVPIRYNVQREIIVESLDAPARAAAGSIVELRVNIRSTTQATGTLRLLINNEEVPTAGVSATSPSGTRAPLGQRITLNPGLNTVVLAAPLDMGRVHRLEALFEPDAPDAPAAAPTDTIALNNRAQAFTITPGTGDILIVDGTNDTAAALLHATLKQQGLSVDVVTPEGFPQDLLKLQAYDAVILQNAQADAIGPQRLESLQRYVTDFGGGLIMIGGPDSFGAGAWRSTPIEPILPVKLDLPEQMIVPPAAVVIVMDTSGSMGWSVMGSARTQQEVANEGAALAVRTLFKDDLIGVIEFNSSARTVVPLSKNADPEATARSILALSPGGGTNLPPALDQAFDQLRDARAQVKHVIVLSDGMSQRKEALPALARSMKAADITLTTIAVGDRADTEMLERIADIGGGAYYRVTDPNTLPRVFLRAIKVVRQPMIREEPFTPVLQTTGSPSTLGLPSNIPPLNGLVLTQPRPPIENNLPTGVAYPMLTPTGEPVLAIWQAGLGQVAAFTSDAHKWAEPWRAWPGYTQFWTQLTRSVARPDVSRSGELALRREGDAVVATLELADTEGKPRDGVLAAGFAYAPDGQRAPITMSQVGPGLYEGRFIPPSSGNFVVTISPQDKDQRLPPIVGGLVVPSGPEYRALSSDETVLAQIARVTNGRVLDLTTPEAANLYSRAGQKPTQARLPLWPVLILWAVGVLIADIATRRIAWDRLVSRKFGASLLREAAAVTSDRSQQAAKTIGSLRQRELTPANPSDKALGEADAQRVIDEARARRRAERQARQQAASTSQAEATPQGFVAPVMGNARQSNTNNATPTTNSSNPPAQTTPKPDTKPAATPKAPSAPIEGESPLQAAKRKARERLGGE